MCIYLVAYLTKLFSYDIREINYDYKWAGIG